MSATIPRDFLRCLGLDGRTATAGQVEASLAASSWPRAPAAHKGWRQGGGGYERWPITSTAIQPAGFAEIAEIAAGVYGERLG